MLLQRRATRERREPDLDNCPWGQSSKWMTILLCQGMGHRWEDCPAAASRHETAKLLKIIADAIGLEPPTSASGDQSSSDFFPRLPGFPELDECAGARESVPFCAPTGLVIPLHIVWLARRALSDPGASEREVKLACWVMSVLQGPGDG